MTIIMNAHGYRTGSQTPHGRTFSVMSSPVVVSVVVPVYNEAECVTAFCERLRSVLDRFGYAYEVIIVDDGSTDLTADLVLQELVPAWPELCLIRLTRNFGHMPALECGLRRAAGEFLVMMDGDLQHPPECIPMMMEVQKNDHVDVVQMVRSDREGDGFLKRIGSNLFYAVSSRVVGVEIAAGTADFRLMSRRVCDAILGLSEKNKVFRLLIPWMGFPTSYLVFDVAERHAGKTKYTLRKMISLARGGFTTFGLGPLRVMTVAGLAAGTFGLLFVVYVVSSWISGGTISGWASVMSAVLLLGGTQLLTFGIFGEYFLVMLAVSRDRPEYVVLDESARTVDEAKKIS